MTKGERVAILALLLALLAAWALRATSTTIVFPQPVQTYLCEGTTLIPDTGPAIYNSELCKGVQ